MKKFKQLVMAFLVGVVSFGFTACDDNNNDVEFELPEVGQATVNVNSSDKEMQKVAKVYVNQVVYPTYQALAANARTLYTTTAALYTAAEAGTMTQAQIDAACEAFKDTRREWERSEAFLYGSASDNELDPHIDSWPLDHDELVNASRTLHSLQASRVATPLSSYQRTIASSSLCSVSTAWSLFFSVTARTAP